MAGHLSQIKCVTGKELKHSLNVRNICITPPVTPATASLFTVKSRAYRWLTNAECKYRNSEFQTKDSLFNSTRYLSWKHTGTKAYLGEWPSTHCIWGWVGPMAGLDVYGKFTPTRLWFLDHPACSELLSQICYPCHDLSKIIRHTCQVSNNK
jgi:hypothetical protein